MFSSQTEMMRTTQDAFDTIKMHRSVLAVFLYCDYKRLYSAYTTLSTGGGAAMQDGTFEEGQEENLKNCLAAAKDHIDCAHNIEERNDLNHEYWIGICEGRLRDALKALNEAASIASGLARV